MEHLSRGLNQSTGDCVICSQSPLFLPAVLSYILTLLPANSWVMRLMMSSPVFWTDKMEVFEFHLVLMELCLALLGFPSIVASFYVSQMQMLSNIIIDLLFTARVQFQCCMCMERYLAVVHPVRFLAFKPLRYRMTLCCVVWLLSILSGLVQSFLCFDSQANIYLYISFFILAVLLDSFFCLSVLWVLKQPTPGKRETEGSGKVKRKAFNIVLMFQVCTLVGCLPLVVMLCLMKNLGVSMYCLVQPISYAVVIWLGALHPLHYLHRSGKIKDGCSL